MKRQAIARAPKTTQGELGFEMIPDCQFASPASARSHSGHVAEEIACTLLGLTPIPIQGACAVNFDAEDTLENFYEIKSVARSAQVVVYCWRLKKEQQTGKSVLYAIVIRSKKGAEDFKCLREMWENRSRTIREIHLVTLRQVANAVKGEKVWKLKSERQSGYNRTGYKDGYWRVNSAKFLKYTRFWKEASAIIHGLPFSARIYRTPGAARIMGD